MSKEELKKKLQEETERSQKNEKRKKPNADKTKRQQKIAEQTKKQLPPQSPVRKKREQEIKRREEKELREKKKHRKRGSNVVYYVALSILAVIIFAVLSVTVLFNTEHIVVSGDSDYTDEQIIAASGLRGDENLVRLSTTGIPEKMLDKLVTLDSVSVEKVFPSTIKITVTRSVPMVSFSYGGRNFVISHIGRVMAIDTDEVDCMHVIGYKPAESVIVGSFIKAENAEQDKLIQQISAAVEKAELKGITSLDITDNLDLIMTYDNRVEIHLGSVLQIDEKMRMINELLYNGYIADTEHVTLNVSDINRAIQRPVTTAPLTTTIITDEPEEGEEKDGETTSAPAEE